MSDPSFGTPGDGERNDAGRVRTYRGRTIEELIPRIREELGPDAIILREREGLTGGIGGFFAQRCVEIDAQAAPRLSVYDDDFDEEDAEYEEAAVADEGPAAPHWSAPAERAPEPLPLQREPSPPLAPEPPTVPPRPAGAFLNEASFAARLEEATLAAGPAAPAPDEPEPEPAPEPESEAPRRGTPAFIAFDELGDDDEPEEEAPAPAPPDSDDASPPTLSHRLLDLAEINYTGPAPAPPIRREPVVREPEPVAWEPEPEPEPEPSPEPEPEPQPEPEADPVDLAPDPTAPWMTFAAEQVTADPPARRASRPSATAESGAPPPFAPPQPPWNAAPRATPAEPVTPAAPEQAAPAPASNGPSPQPNPYGGQSPATPYQPWGPAAYGPRRRGGILPAAERVLRAALDATHAANERRSLELQARYTAPPHLPSPSATPEPSPSLAPEPASPPPPPEPDADATRRQAEQARAARLQERLVESGVSPQRAAALVTTAVSRRGPFSADTELAQELRSAITSALPAPTPVPRRGAIAVVGAGGSGKTRSVAALATAYADAGIPVSVATFGGSAREDELGELLHGEDVNIMPAMRTRATGRAVASAREESLVIVDTASVTPGTGSAMDVIAEALRGFELDAIYLAVPATLSLPAGLKLMSGFSAFDLAGIIATHVDEADQLGVIAELAMRTSVPIAYTHTGLDLQNAIASADAGDIATSLV